MKWFKHDSDANMDAKLQSVMLDYGLEGYGLYWYCIELVAQNVNGKNLTFELEHDARIIARNTGSTPQKVEAMMKTFVELGLLDANNGHIFALKLASRADDFTAKAIRNEEKLLEKQQLRLNRIKSDFVPLEEEEEEEEEEEKKKKKNNKDLLSEEKISDSSLVIEHFNKICNTKYRKETKSHIENINGRLADGHSVEDLKKVIESKHAEWKDDPKMAQYIRPQTLFATGKFQGYLIASRTVKKITTANHTFGQNDYNETI